MMSIYSIALNDTCGISEADPGEISLRCQCASSPLVAGPKTVGFISMAPCQHFDARPEDCWRFAVTQGPIVGISY